MLGIFLDSETNGLNPFKHKIIEVSFQIVNLKTGALLENYESVVTQSYEDWKDSNPESLRINGFTWEELSRGKQKETISQEIQNCFLKYQIQRTNSVFICQNPSFDRAFFSQLISTEIQEQKQWPYHWLDLASMYWALAIKQKTKDKTAPYPWETGLSKDKIALTHSIPKEDKPHRAMNGVDHLLACYKAVVGFPS